MKSEQITTHYSAAELRNLIDAANQVCADDSRKSPALVILKSRGVGRGLPTCMIYKKQLARPEGFEPPTTWFEASI
jgi:hypothetical protein